MKDPWRLVMVYGPPAAVVVAIAAAIFRDPSNVSLPEAIAWGVGIAIYITVAERKLPRTSS